MPLLIFIFKFVQHLILKERNHQHKQEHDYTDRRTEAQICLRIQTASKGVTVKYHAGKIQAAAWRRRGYGKALIEFVCARYASSCHSLQLGTGEVPSTLAFYRACGFVPFDRIPAFFTRNYPRPIVEEGGLLRDMVYLRRRLSAGR